MLTEFIKQANECVAPTIIQLVNASKWLDTNPPEADQILENVVDAGDKLVIIAPSKMRKSFFTAQLALALTAHSKFLGWRVPKQRRVLYIQFEIREHHCHKRIKNLARAMDIGSADLGDRLMVVSARGLGLTGAEGLERIKQAAEKFRPEVIILDPIYKLAVGVENAAEDFKILLNAFDVLAEETGAAIFYVHHDTKGAAGDKDIRDRGAGSNVLGRDYDACVTLTQHATEPEAIVVDMLLRNYAPQEPFTIVWEQQQDTGGYCFRMADDLMADKRTSKTKPPAPPISSYLPAAKTILSTRGKVDIGYFKALFKEETHLSDHRIRDFLTWAINQEHPPILTMEERPGRGRGIKKWVWVES